MKRVVIVVAIILSFSSAYSQKKIESKISLNNRKCVFRLEYADSIILSSWGKDEIVVTVTIKIDNNKANDDYELVASESGSEIYYSESIKDLIPKNQIIKIRTDDGKEFSRPKVPMDLFYEIFVPEDAEIDLFTTNGDISVKGLIGDVRIEVVDAEIEYYLTKDQNSDIKIHSTSGEVFGDVELSKSLKIHESSIEEINITGKYNGGGKLIDLESVGGNIYLHIQR